MMKEYIKVNCGVGPIYYVTKFIENDMGHTVRHEDIGTLKQVTTSAGKIQNFIESERFQVLIPVS